MAARFKALCSSLLLQEIDQESYVILLQVQTERSRQLLQSRASSLIRRGGGHCATHKLEQGEGNFLHSHTCTRIPELFLAASPRYSPHVNVTGGSAIESEILYLMYVELNRCQLPKGFHMYYRSCIPYDSYCLCVAGLLIPDLRPRAKRGRSARADCHPQSPPDWGDRDIACHCLRTGPANAAGPFRQHHRKVCSQNRETRRFLPDIIHCSA